MLNEFLRKRFFLASFFVLVILVFSQASNLSAAPSLISPSNLLNAYKNYVLPGTETSKVKEADILAAYKDYVSQGSIPLASLATTISLSTAQDTKTIYIEGPPGPPGPIGPQGPAGPAGTSGGFAPLAPPSFAPPNYNNNQTIGISGGFSSLGVQDLNATTLRVTGVSTLASLTVTGGITSSGALTGTGLTLSGLLSFTGTDHAGIKLNNLTTVQRDALTAAAGFTIFNTTATKMQVYNGTAWKNVGNPEIGGDVESGTAGSVLFVGTGAVLAQDNASFFFDDTNNRIGILDATPAAALTVGSGDLFQVNSSGAIAAVVGITSSAQNIFTATAGTAPFILRSVTATDDDITLLSFAGGAGRFAGIITTADITTADKTYTFPDVTGFVALDTTAATTGNVLLETEIDASSELLALMDDETGTGLLVFATTPTLTTPVLGVATGTSLALTYAGTTTVTTASGLVLNANSLTTGTGLYAASSTLTSGLLVDLQVSGTAAAASQTALNILTAGANATAAITTYGAQISNTHTNATSGTNIALYLNASGATTANYGLIVNAGRVGIGNTAPQAEFDVQFGVSKSAFIGGTDGSGERGVKIAQDASGYAYIQGIARLDDTARDLSLQMDGGNIGIGDLTPAALLTVGAADVFQVNSTGAIAAATGITSSGSVAFSGEAGANAEGYVCIATTTGAISAKATACTGSSSLRYKENIENLSLGLDAVLQMRPVSFDWKKEYIINPHAARQIGFIAEEMEQISPLFVTYEDGLVDGVEYMKLTSVLAAAIQEMNLKIEDLAIPEPLADSFADKFFTNLFAKVTSWLADADRK